MCRGDSELWTARCQEITDACVSNGCTAPEVENGSYKAQSGEVLTEQAN